MEMRLLRDIDCASSVLKVAGERANEQRLRKKVPSVLIAGEKTPMAPRCSTKPQERTMLTASLRRCSLSTVARIKSACV